MFNPPSTSTMSVFAKVKHFNLCLPLCLFDYPVFMWFFQVRIKLFSAFLKKAALSAVKGNVHHIAMSNRY